MRIPNKLRRSDYKLREIKFRGKRLDNGEWVYGSLLMLESQEKSLEPLHCYIFSLDKGCHRVIPDTVGQFTGLHDKNGKEIYEGDIALATLKFFNINDKKCKIIFHNGSFGVQYGFSTDYFKPFSAWDVIEVIDNIYDNPELLKED